MSLPEIIYKYRDWDNPLHRSVLLHNELYFASPKDFNDPFDCRITHDFSMLSTQETKKAYTNKLLINTRDQWLDGSKDPIKLMQDFDNRLSDTETLQEEYNAYTFKKQDLHYGVLCFSTLWNNILMWSHYSNDHTGVCIGFREEIFRQLRSFRGKGSKVIYKDDFPKISPLLEDTIEQMFLETHCKSTLWEYESEYRLSTLFFPEEPTQTERILTVPNETIVEVVLGLNISNSNAREVVTICKDRLIPVYQTFKVPRRFELDRKLIE